MASRVLSAALLAVAVAGCETGGKATPRVPRAHDPGPRPDEMPALLNAELPFRYPAELYTRKVQANVTLRLFIDRDGRVQPESTLVDEPSGYAAFDSAAIRGSADLHFVPAKVHGEPIAVSLLFPVYFRHPEARPLPGDTILQRGRAGSGLQ